MKWIPTKIHGALDYITAAGLWALPQVLGWDDTLTQRVRAAAVGTALYSIVTQYEWGVGPLTVLPMRGHLAADGASGVLFCAAPLLVPRESQAVKQILVGIGIFELLVTLSSQSTPAGGK